MLSRISRYATLIPIMHLVCADPEPHRHPRPREPRRPASQKVYFKLRGDAEKIEGRDKFIGHLPDRRELKLVGPSEATLFTIEPTKDKTVKHLTIDHGKKAFTQEGSWIETKWFEVDDNSKGDSKQELQLIYTSRNTVAITKDGWCLSQLDGWFRKLDCADPGIDEFIMCRSTADCDEPTRERGDVNRSLHSIQRMLEEMMRNGPGEARRRRRGPDGGSPPRGRRRRSLSEDQTPGASDDDESYIEPAPGRGKKRSGCTIECDFEDSDDWYSGSDFGN